MTVGLPSGVVRTMTVPPGLRPGDKIQLAVPQAETQTALDKIAASAKSAVAKVQQKAREEEWDRKAKTAAASAVSAGSQFVAGFKKALSDGSSSARHSHDEPPPYSPGPLPPPPPPPPVETTEGTARPTQGVPRAANGDIPAQPHSVPVHDGERHVVAIVPDGLEPGNQMLVATPLGFKQIVVPPGCYPGSQLEVLY